MKIIPIDCHYVEEEFACAYLLIHEGRGFFVECNTNHAIPYLKKAAIAHGLKLEDIEGLLITHVHLDHAGGAGLFLKEFPRAKLYAHPRAARHAIDPSKLVASATQVYGEAFMKKMYGEILPCSKERVVVLEDGDSISFHGVAFQTKWVKGHANHHLVMIDPETKTCFTGDSFGVSYPKINSKYGIVILPSTSPTDFDGDEAISAVEWIRAQHFNQLALTHYQMIEKNKIDRGATTLIDLLQYSKKLMMEITSEKLDTKEVERRLKDFTKNYFKNKKIELSDSEWKHLHIDLSVNAQGLHWRAEHPLVK